jgi:hypothetical protein
MPATHNGFSTSIQLPAPSSSNRQNVTRTNDLYAPTPSSSTAGFFQTAPTVQNQFHDDLALQRGLKLFLPDDVRSAIAPDLSTFGDKVLSRQILGWVLDAERNIPYVKTWDSWGKRRDELITSEGWRNLQRVGIEEGMVAIPYENQYREYSRVYYFAKYAIWAPSSVWTTCPNLMVDGVATLLRRHLTHSKLSETEQQVFRSDYDKLVSRDPEYVWTTGQWMTERQGKVRCSS